MICIQSNEGLHIIYNCSVFLRKTGTKDFDMGRLTLTYIGFSAEKSSVGIPTPDLGVANVESYTDGGVSTAFDALVDAVDALTLMNRTGHTATAQAEALAETLPASANAQREIGLQMFMSDVNGHKSRLVIPGVDLGIVAQAGTDLVDLTVTEVAALVTALETYAIDPITGLAVTVYAARIVGRNN